jgi:hypothetical protein
MGTRDLHRPTSSKNSGCSNDAICLLVKVYFITSARARTHTHTERERERVCVCVCVRGCVCEGELP